jgi:hypothetical protein
MGSVGLPRSVAGRIEDRDQFNDAHHPSSV